MSEKIFYQKDWPKDPHARGKWVQELNASGFVGITKRGQVVDRREFKNAMPIPANALFGIAKPKPLPQ